MDQCVDEMNTHSPTNDTTPAKNHDIYLNIKSGKWVAKIWHPIRKVRVCIGIYNNHEEAADAYARKKLQYESDSLLLQETGTLCHTNIADTENRQCGKLTASGKWGASIKHKGVCVWLGSYNTRNEAADAYNLSKLEFQSLKSSSLRKIGGGAVFDSQFEAADASGQENCSLDSGFGPSSIKEGITQAVSSPCVVSHIRGIGGRGSVYRVKSGKWKAEIQINKVKHKVGFFSTAEDAREALNRKKCELGMEVEDAEETLNREKCLVTVKTEEAVQAKSVVDAGQSERYERRCHAYLQTSGRFSTEIWHPLKKGKKIYLGTFDTPQEAEDVFNNTRRQFESMFPGYMNRKQPKEIDSLESLTEEAKEAYNNKMCEIDLIACAYKKPRLPRCSYNADDTVASVDGSSVIEVIKGEDINVTVENETGFVSEESRELDFGVIDSYGQLVDEFSRMDDELWVL